MEVVLQKNQEIKPGTVILTEKPFVYVLSSKYRTEHCDFCFQKNELLKCSSCRYVYYCDKVCQKEGWATHKLECNHLKEIYPREVPNAARLLARLIKKLEKGGNTIKSYYGRNKFRMFKDLMSHYPDIKEDALRIEHLQSLCVVLKSFMGDSFTANMVELLGIYGRMCVNSFNICNDELNSLGTGMYLAASILDHSCEPNAVAIFDGTTLNLRVTKTMPCLDWNKVFISYIDTLQLRQVRQKELLSTYYFLCECPRCVDIEEEQMMTAAACSNTGCDACVEIKSDTHCDFELTCESCDTPITKSFIKQYEEITELSEFHLKNMKLAYLDVCKVCLNKQEGILHKLNVNHIRILDSAFESSIDFNQWDNAKKFGIELIDGYRKYLGVVHPLTGLLHLKLAKIFMYEENITEGRYHLEQAYDILKITHGVKSDLFKRELMPLLHSL